MTEAHQVRGREVPGGVRFRVLVTLAGAVAAWMIAPVLIPNLAFRLMATAATAIVVWDHRLIAAFYVAMFRQLGPRLRGKIDQAWLILLPSLLLCALMLWMFISIVVAPIEPDWGVFRYDTVPVLVGSLTIMLVLPSVHSAATRTATWLEGRPSWVHGVLLTGVLGILFTIQLRLAISIYLFPGWDVDAVLKNAFGVADGSVDAIDPDYFTKYPNNIMLVLILAQFSKIVLALGATDLLLASVVLNAAVLLAGVLLTYLVARRLAGAGTAILTLVPSTVFLVVSPWIAVPYSDSFGLLFPVLLLYLYLIARNATRCWSRLLVWSLIGFVGLVGFNIKPTVIFVLIAIVLVFLTSTVLVRSTLREKAVALGLVGAALGVFAAGSSAVTQIQQNSPVISFDVTNNPKAFPLTHFLKMGATGYGAFTQTDVWETADIKDPDERFQNGLDVYAQRVQAMGPAGYADFLARKAIWTFGDGTFHMWTEGVVKSQDDPFISKDPTSRSIQDYLWAKGEHFPFTMGVWQSFWLVIILLTAAPLVLRGGKLFTGPSAIMRLSLLALFLFLLLFETRSRYLYLYLPFFILLATLTLDSVMARLPDLRPLPEPRSAPAAMPASRG